MAVKSFSPRQQWLALLVAAGVLAVPAVSYLRSSPAPPPPVATLVRAARVDLPPLPAGYAALEAGSIPEPAALEPATSGPILPPRQRHAASPKAGFRVSFPVDLNRASERDLDAVPGIGPVTAGRILALRAQLGRFRGLDELKRIKGIKDRRLAKLAPYLTVRPEPQG